MTFTFEVSDEIFSKFPDYIVGCVFAHGIDANVERLEIERVLADAVLRSRVSYEQVDLKTLPQFAAWREAFSRAGWSASRFPSSVEALHRRVQRGNDPPSINPAVDLANSAALLYSVPIGTHDIDSLGGHPLTVRTARETDTFIDMNGEPDPPSSGEIVYAAGDAVRTRRWVWRQSRSALVGPGATNVFFPIDGFESSTLDAVEGALNFLARAAGDHLRANVTTDIVNAARPRFSG